MVSTLLVTREAGAWSLLSYSLLSSILCPRGSTICLSTPTYIYHRVLYLYIYHRVLYHVTSICMCVVPRRVYVCVLSDVWCIYRLSQESIWCIVYHTTAIHHRHTPPPCTTTHHTRPAYEDDNVVFGIGCLVLGMLRLSHSSLTLVWYRVCYRPTSIVLCHYSLMCLSTGLLCVSAAHEYCVASLSCPSLTLVSHTRRASLVRAPLSCPCLLSLSCLYLLSLSCHFLLSLSVLCLVSVSMYLPVLHIELLVYLIEHAMHHHL